jgi:GNAT superfamily N-acetyltransferase
VYQNKNRIYSNPLYLQQALNAKSRKMKDIKENFFNLLDESFPGIKANILRCEGLGFPWNSTPYFKEENGEILSHVGFLEYPIAIDGKFHKAAALHAICTKKSFRGRGLASELIREALNWAEKQYEFVILFTEIPKFYEKLSFQCIQEYRFHLPCKKPKGTQLLTPVVSPRDNELFLSCFQNRAPTSNCVWMKDDGDIASFNTLFATYPAYWSLYYSHSMNGILSYELKGKTLHLYDVIASSIPSLDMILEHLPGAIDDIYFYFSPDRFTDAAIPEPYLYDNGHFLVHGKWPCIEPFMIAPLSRC